jgi:hypothetical protein
LAYDGATMSDEFYAPDSTAVPRQGSRVKSLFTTLIILGLLGAVGYLLAERNHRTYSVVRQGNSLVVMRGVMLPLGTEPYQPGDRALAEIYAPIPIQNDSPGDLLTRTYSDRDDLDRELFHTLSSWINARLSADSSDKLKEAVTYLHRAERLTGITDEERKQLEDMRAETGFYEGRAKLDEGLDALSSALEKLELAAGSKSRHAREAGALLLQVQDPVRAAVRAARVAPTAASLLVPTAPVAAAPEIEPPAAPKTAPSPIPASPPEVAAPAAAPSEPKDAKAN